MIRRIYIFLFALLISACQYTYPFELRFNHLTEKDGLSDGIVQCIIQDSKGFMWFGTPNGLNRYDGNTINIYQHDSADSNSLSSNYINTIFIDSKGFLWVGTYGGGLNRMDLKTNRILHYQHNPDSINSISDNIIFDIHEDTKGFFWIATQNGLNKLVMNSNDPERPTIVRYMYDATSSQGLGYKTIKTICEDRSGLLWLALYSRGIDCFNPVTEEFIHYQGKSSGLSSNFVYNLYSDRQGILWACTASKLDGLHYFDSVNDQFIQVTIDSKDPTGIVNTQINAIYEDDKGIFWIATDGGLVQYDRKTQQSIKYQSVEGDPNSLSNNSILDIYEDRTHVLWIGARNGGVNLCDLQQKPFYAYKHDPMNPNSLNHNEVAAVYEDKHGILWVGQERGSGLTKIDRKNNRFNHFLNDPEDTSSLSSNTVLNITEDQNGYLWIGTYKGGLNRFDRKSETFKSWQHNPDDLASISGNFIRAPIYEDPFEPGKTLWLGLSHEAGLNKFNVQTNTFTWIPYNPGGPNNYNIFSIHKLNKDTLLLGTSEGLFICNLKENISKRYIHEQGNINSLSNNLIYDIHIDQDSIFWIGTADGLNRFELKTETFTIIKEKDGLPNNVINGILEDDHGYLWLSTNKGLSKFNKETYVFRNYDETDGLSNNKFFMHSCYKNNFTGELFFGGYGGLVYFHPDSIKDNPYIPSVIITQFSVYNHPVKVKEKVDGRIILDQNITYTNSLTLSYKTKIFAVEYSAIHFASPSENSYAFKMDGFEDEWNHVGNRTMAAYTGLPPGRYTFRVKAANCDGLWNEEGTSLEIHILSPFWQTWCFRSVTTMLLVSFLILGYKSRTHAIRKRNEQLESINIELHSEIHERKLAQEQNEVLLKEIHHRVKNNMQVISSLLSLQSKQINDKKLLSMFKESQNRVKSMALIHEKLYQSKDFSHIDFKEYVEGLTREVCNSIRVAREDVKIEFDIENIFISIDQAVPCGLIINELITNSLKYAFPEKFEGTPNIKIQIVIEDENLIIMVSDNGMSIPKDVELGRSESLGLNLVEILACDQLNGQIEILRNQGTKFIISFKLKE